MLKGTTKIELTDVHTGEKQVVEKHNMLTNAMNQIFQPTLGHLTNETTLRGYLPAYKTLLGGLLLFDDNIPENVNQLFAPIDVNLTGCASYNVQNTDGSTYRGSYNINESSYDSANKKMTFVYDFTTAQGNGTIASVCLSHLNAGYGTYRCDKQTLVYGTASCYTKPKSFLMNNKDKMVSFSVGADNEFIFCIDTENDIGYYFSVTDTSNVKLIKRRLGLRNITLLSSYLNVIEEISFQTLTTAIKSRVCYNFDEKDNALYIISTASSSVAVNSTFLVTKITFGTWAVTQYTVTNTADKTLDANTNFAYIHDGYFYCFSQATPYYCYKIKLNNSADIVKLDGDMGSYIYTPLFAINGRVYFGQHRSNYEEAEGGVYIANSKTNKLERCGNRHLYLFLQSYRYTACWTPVKGKPMLYYLSNGTVTSSSYPPEFMFLCNYLATINNLTEAVVKTADKTMKITYIIQEV